MRHEDTLAALTDLAGEGKVRVLGCGNETCWGVMKSLWASDLHGLARFDSVQNNFSVLNRRCQSELTQVCRQEQISLLPYSPLAGGVLSGKYNGGAVPDGARFTAYLATGNERQKRMARRFVNERTLAATESFLDIATEAGIPAVTLATAWSKQHDFVASTILGATTTEQLKQCLAAADLLLEDAVLKQIDAIEETYPNSFHEDGLRWQ
jgi:aryl-alcohol dehydrogenase-like predicted oxidoreductase